MSDKPSVFLTDERRAVLNDEYEGAENTERTHRSRIRARSRTALKELIEVAHSPEIDNADVYDPDDVYILISTLTGGTGGLVYKTEKAQEKALENAEPNTAIAWDPDPAYANELKAKLAKLLLEDQYDDE